MGRPQFQIFTRRAGSVEWRLIGANNWELGRCAGGFPDLEASVADVTHLKSVLGGLRSEVFSASRSGGWRWQLLDGDDIAAVGSRVFARRSACESTLRQFRTVAAEARVTPRLRYFT